MKRLLMSIALLSFSGTAIAQSSVYVPGYVRSDGKYVQGHYRSAPDGNPYNNYSTRGNINPYTGRVGTRNPYTPSPSPYGGALYQRYSNPYSSGTSSSYQSPYSTYAPPSPSYSNPYSLYGEDDDSDE